MPVAVRLSTNQILGKSGEALACAELERRGYAILARRRRVGRGDLDIIAREGRTLVFVEVKTRSSAAFGGPTEAVTWRKRRRLRRLARDYLEETGQLGAAYRFDVVAIMVPARGPARVEVIADAFGGDDWS